MVISLSGCLAQQRKENKLGKAASCLPPLRWKWHHSSSGSWSTAGRNREREDNCFLETHLFPLRPPMEDAVPTSGGRASPPSAQTPQVLFWKGRKSSARTVNRRVFLVGNRTYGRSLSSGKSLDRLPAKTFHESLLARQMLNLKVWAFKNRCALYRFVQLKAWERSSGWQKSVVILLSNKTNLPGFIQNARHSFHML